MSVIPQVRLTRVPVLSEQIAVALPIVSHARRTLTRLFSFNIFVVAKARASVTARGKPSGTATTMMVTATMRISINDEALSVAGRSSPGRLATKRNKRTKKRRPAAAPPRYAMELASLESFFWRGVSSVSVRTDIMILP